MGEWIKNDNAILVFYELDKVRISVVLITFHNHLASYGSSATLNRFSNLNGVGEKIQFEVIKYLKKKNILYYELGYQYFLMDKIRLGVSDKDLNISRYKNKFGGVTTTKFAGVKNIDISTLKT